MDFVIYFYIFLMGITFGSFFTLAVYRIPLGQDITHNRSYCPNCNHKLSNLDLIPLFSYIFLRGKCRYCKEKIRPRYFLLELFSGIVFILFALSIKMSIYTINISKIIYFIFGLLYIAGLFIISGIEKEKIQIQTSLLIYLIVIESFYIIYLYIVEKANIYRYVIQYIAIAILMIFNVIYYKKKLKNNYTIQNLILLIEMLVFTYEACTILTIIFTLLSIAIKMIIEKIKGISRRNIKNNKQTQIPFGFYLCVTNIITLLITNILIFYR